MSESSELDTRFVADVFLSLYPLHFVLLKPVNFSILVINWLPSSFRQFLKLRPLFLYKPTIQYTVHTLYKRKLDTGLSCATIRQVLVVFPADAWLASPYYYTICSIYNLYNFLIKVVKN